MISRALILFLLTVSTLLADFNRIVLEEARAMPKGGGYATNLEAHRALASSVIVADDVLFRPEDAMPAYCSGATYLVFLKTLKASARQRHDFAVPKNMGRTRSPTATRRHRHSAGRRKRLGPLERERSRNSAAFQ